MIKKHAYDLLNAASKKYRYIKSFKLCACLYCCKVFPAAEVKTFGRRIPHCPKCGEDFLVGVKENKRTEIESLLKGVSEYLFNLDRWQNLV